MEHGNFAFCGSSPVDLATMADNTFPGRIHLDASKAKG
jgi:hypothetical protein